MGKKQRKTGQALVIFLTLATLLVGALNIGCYQYLCLDSRVTVSTEAIELPQGICTARAVMQVSGQLQGAAETNGTELLDLQIFDGSITVKTLSVTRNKQINVIPGGQAIGILLRTDGASVVGLSPVITDAGVPTYPAQEAGMQTGDFITAVNGMSIAYDLQVAEQVQKSGEQSKAVVIDYIRNQQKQSIEVMPQYCSNTQSWRIGLYIRDNTAGVGTLTFYEPKSGKYAALGHQISDPDCRGSSSADKGSIIHASIQGVKIGEAGNPGEKLGAFVNDTWRGTIEKNCLFGIYGKLQNGLDNCSSAAIPVACCDEVRTGAAQIYTVLDGQNVECFDIAIVKLLPNYKLSGKGMIIEVTDAALLERTGGIVQGMSGSPIVQDGKLIGAVTHVFINDPKRGYGCMAEWMMQEAGLWE